MSEVKKAHNPTNPSQHEQPSPLEKELPDAAHTLPSHPSPDAAHTLSPHPDTKTDHLLEAHKAEKPVLELPAHPEMDAAHLLEGEPHKLSQIVGHPEPDTTHQLIAHQNAHTPSEHGPWTVAEDQFLKEAALYLENPSFLMRVADSLGKPLEWLVSQLPEVAHQTVHKALEKALEVAVMTLPEKAETPEDAIPLADWSPTLHTLATAVSGALGGALGALGLAVELPFSTGVMMRSIASIAQSHGEDIRDPAVQLECMAVLSHGGSPEAQESMDSAYLTSRSSLTLLLREASSFVARVSARELAEAVSKGTAPRIVVLLAQIANRFGVVVSQKFFAQALPVIGAIGGGFVNAAFADHFQRVARYHFGIRSLERRYGSEIVLDAYRHFLPLASSAQKA